MAGRRGGRRACDRGEGGSRRRAPGQEQPLTLPRTGGQLSLEPGSCKPPAPPRGLEPPAPLPLAPQHGSPVDSSPGGCVPPILRGAVCKTEEEARWRVTAFRTKCENQRRHVITHMSSGIVDERDEAVSRLLGLHSDPTAVTVSKASPSLIWTIRRRGTHRPCLTLSSSKSRCPQHPGSS